MPSKVKQISTIPNRRDALEAKLVEIMRASSQRDDLNIEYQADPIDEVRIGIDRDVTIEQLNRRSQMGQDIRSALEKLKSGDYGTCEECEEPISLRRLDAVPWARLCVKCQSKAEAARLNDERFDDAA